MVFNEQFFSCGHYGDEKGMNPASFLLLQHQWCSSSRRPWTTCMPQPQENLWGREEAGTEPPAGGRPAVQTLRGSQGRLVHPGVPGSVRLASGCSGGRRLWSHPPPWKGPAGQWAERSSPSQALETKLEEKGRNRGAARIQARGCLEFAAWRAGGGVGWGSGVQAWEG